MKLHYSFLLAIIVATSSCSNDIKSSLGLRKQAPDEFFVISNPPLSVPPEFELQPPASIPQIKVNKNYDSLEGGGYTQQKGHDNSFTAEEKMFLDKLSNDEPKTYVDKIIDQENFEKQKAIENKNPIAKTLHKIRGEDEDKVIDPVSEKKRIKQNLKDGVPVNEGDIPNKAPDSTLKRLFN